MSDPYSLYDYLEENVGCLFRRTTKAWAYWNMDVGTCIQILEVKKHYYACETCGVLKFIHKNKIKELEWSLYKENNKEDFLKVFEKVE